MNGCSGGGGGCITGASDGDIYFEVINIDIVSTYLFLIQINNLYVVVTNVGNA